MELKVLKCPNCEASVNVNNNMEKCYCGHCGYEIIIREENKVVAGTRMLNNLIDKATEVQMKKVNMKYEKQIARQKAEEERQRQAKKMIPLMLVIFAVLLGMMYFGKFQDNKEQVRLEQLASQAQQYIHDGDYDNAYIVASQIAYTGNWSSGSKEKWDAVRNDLMNLIENKSGSSTTKATNEMDRNKDETSRNEKETDELCPEGEYNLAYVRKGRNYDIYYLLNTDYQQIVSYTTDCVGIYTTYKGGIYAGIDITYSNGDGTYFHEYLKSDTADSNEIVTMSSSYEEYTYTFEIIDVEEALKFLVVE